MAQQDQGTAQQRAEDGAGPRPGGGLDGLLGTAPVFTGAVRGYDRMQVDAYVDWAETEVLVLRRENDHLLTRYAAVSADLQAARARLSSLVRERDAAPGPEEARALYERAEREAAALTAAAEEEARQVLDDARTEAAARLSGVAEMREAVAALREQTRSEAAAVLEAARREADGLRRAAAEERDRLDREAAEARARADAEALERRRALESELAPLYARCEQAREWLRRLTGQLDEALAVVAGALPGDVAVLADRRESAAADGPAAPADGTAAADGGASQLTVLQGGSRPEVAAAS
ncbi:DivIVA domain-containing protein [Geodermatophilus sp. SYSU D01119]